MSVWTYFGGGKTDESRQTKANIVGCPRWICKCNNAAISRPWKRRKTFRSSKKSARQWSGSHVAKGKWLNSQNEAAKSFRISIDENILDWNDQQKDELGNGAACDRHQTNYICNTGDERRAAVVGETGTEACSAESSDSKSSTVSNPGARNKPLFS